MADEIVVVGAGAAGLIVSALLGTDARVTLVERLPAPGGQEPEAGWTDALAADARAAGASMRLGTLAVRWDGARLDTLGHAGALRFGAEALVIATGTRPATAAELGIAGDRFAGLIPGPAALHLSDSGVLLGRRPVVLGGGSLAASCARAFRRAGAEHVTLVAPDGVLDPAVRCADSLLEGWTVRQVLGAPRVQAVVLARSETRERLATDALVLAHRRVAMRNIEGAIAAAPRVISCQSSRDPKSPADARATAERAAAEALEAMAAASSRPVSVSGGLG